MQTFKPPTKLLVIPALCPSFAAAEGLWDGVKAGAGSAYERGRSLVTKPFSRGVSIYRVTESGMRLEATLFGTLFWPDEALNAPAPVGNN